MQSPDVGMVDKVSLKEGYRLYLLQREMIHMMTLTTTYYDVHMCWQLTWQMKRWNYVSLLEKISSAFKIDSFAGKGLIYETILCQQV